jgi:hypothetical protein
MSEDRKYVGPEGFADVLSDLMERTKRIKIMLWAGDAIAARREMVQIRQLHEKTMFAALRVKAKANSRTLARAIRARVKPNYLEERRKGWELEYLLKADVARSNSVTDQTSAALFAIAPVASLVTKLDHRISGETNQREVFHEFAQLTEGSTEEEKLQIVEASSQERVVQFHEASGFNLLIFARGDESWEMRGYQMDPPPLERANLLSALQAMPDVFSESIEEDIDDISWPLRIHGFSKVAHFRLSILDPGRFAITLALKRTEERGNWFGIILDAIARSQIR